MINDPRTNPAIRRALDTLRREPATVEIRGRSGSLYRVLRFGALVEIEYDGVTIECRL